MILCPSCQQSVEILDMHLGTLFTCPHCNAVYFIDWNGQPEIATADESAPEPLPEHLPEHLPEPSQNEETPYVNEAPYDFSQSLDSASMVAAPEDFSDVTEFANSNSNIGPLSYTVIIDGIDSSQLLIQLKDAMTDSRFAWEETNLLAQIVDTRLVLPGLSPTKASVLISRIKYLPLKISWRQDVLAST